MKVNEMLYYKSIYFIQNNMLTNRFHAAADVSSNFPSIDVLSPYAYGMYRTRTV